MQDVNGSTLRIGQYESINGSPYLYDEWERAIIKFADGEIFQVEKLKYDQISNQLIFSNKDGIAMAFIKPVVQFEFMSDSDDSKNNRKFKNGYPVILGGTEASYYEVLAEGKITLLKRSYKAIREEKSYNSATINKNIIENTNYFVYNTTDNKIMRFKKDSKGIMAILNNSKEAESYLKENKLDIKKDSDLIKLITYYNNHLQ
ncbi:hypothetical protein [Pontibacter sp. SGAir0037]|uniref:hypothetical protein n=1 Tax=Pontibacter sp. SGAir0037 TaxID=2571030 RepID=UPI0010CD31A8|nr:hypothetical protein [Pontibacter sp. SGAir0037]QCR23641.1 hypothetical protein C1N53_15685 [Pontibacter sp. SGAir0037]